MNDGKKEEDMSSPEEAVEIGGRPDVGAADDVGSAPDPGADASVLEHAETSSPDQRTTDSEQASKGVSCLAGPLGVEVPSSENGGNALDATAVDNLSIEVSSEAEGAAEPGIQLPAVVHGGPVARYAPPIPYEPHAAFLLEVERSLPPNFELDGRTGRIFTRSTTLRQIPLCGPLRVSARNRTSAGTGWSFDLQFLNLDGILCSHVVLASELLVNGRAVVARLMDLGLDVVGEPAMLAHMIRNTEVDARAVTVHAPGWTTGPNPAFVMPTGEVVAPEVPDALLRYEYQGPRWDKAAVAGRLKNWKALLAVYAVGNPAMVFAISYALLGPLLSILGSRPIDFGLLA